LMTMRSPHLLAPTRHHPAARASEHAAKASSRSPSVQTTWTIDHTPRSCWLASTTVVIGWHVPALFQLGLHSQAWHESSRRPFRSRHALWWPVVPALAEPGRWPRWSLPMYLFMATLPCDDLSAFSPCGRVVYPHSLSRAGYSIYLIWGPTRRVRAPADVGFGLTSPMAQRRGRLSNCYRRRATSRAEGQLVSSRRTAAVSS